MHISTKCSVAFHCLIFISEFGEEKKITSEVLSGSTGCNAVIIRNTLNALQKAGIISVARGVGGARLIKKANTVTMWDVYSAIEHDGLLNLIGIHPNPSCSCCVGREIESVLKEPYLRVAAAAKAEMQNITLCEIITGYRQRQGGLNMPPNECACGSCRCGG